MGGNFVEVLSGGLFFNLESGFEIVDIQGVVSFVFLLMCFVSGGEE